VLEEMGDAGNARKLVTRPDLIVNLQRDDGQTAVRKHEQSESVSQGKMLHDDLGLPGSRIKPSGRGHAIPPARDLRKTTNIVNSRH
jgi:hypothetical protein